MFYYTNSFNKTKNLLDELMGNPMRELEKVSIFDTTRSYSPTETEDSHIIEVSVPGFSKKDIEVEVNDGTLIISSEIKEEETLSIHDKELELIIKALERNHGKRKPAADELGISERTLYRKIKQHDIEL